MTAIASLFKNADGVILCALCRNPVGLKGQPPAITLEVVHKDTGERGKALAHRTCARNKVGLA